MAENVTVTDLRVGTDSLRRDIADAKNEFGRMSRDLSKDPIVIKARLDSADLRRQVREETTRMAAAAGAGGFDPQGWKGLDPAGWGAINSRSRAADRVADFPGGIRMGPALDAVSAPAGGGSSDGPSYVGFSKLAIGLGTLNGVATAAAHAMDNLATRIEEGTANAGDSIADFIGDLVGGLPLIGGFEKFGESYVRAKQAEQFKAMGLTSQAEMRGIEMEARSAQKRRAEAKSLAEQVDTEVVRGERGRETAGLEGADLARAQARQTAEEHQDRLDKLIAKVNEQADRKPVMDQLEKLQKEKDAVAADLAERLADIDAKAADAMAQGASAMAAQAGAAALRDAEQREHEMEQEQRELDRETQQRLRELNAGAEQWQRELDQEHRQAARELEERHRPKGGGFIGGGGADYGRSIQNAILGAPGGADASTNKFDHVVTKFDKATERLSRMQLVGVVE